MPRHWQLQKQTYDEVIWWLLMLKQAIKYRIVSWHCFQNIHMWHGTKEKKQQWAPVLMGSTVETVQSLLARDRATRWHWFLWARNLAGGWLLVLCRFQILLARSFGSRALQVSNPFGKDLAVHGLINEEGAHCRVQWVPGLVHPSVLLMASSDGPDCDAFWQGFPANANIVIK